MKMLRLHEKGGGMVIIDVDDISSVFESKEDGLCFIYPKGGSGAHFDVKDSIEDVSSILERRCEVEIISSPEKVKEVTIAPEYVEKEEMWPGLGRVAEKIFSSEVLERMYTNQKEEE